MRARPVQAADAPDLAALFATERTTRHCWCMAFCTTRTQFALGWFGGGNRRRFGSMAAGSATPMGVLAEHSGQPVGWAACGPRSRYADAIARPGSPLRGRIASEDQSVWLLPCLFVRDGFRGRGVSHTLVQAAVELARDAGATALEGWPPAATERDSAEAFLGREQVFRDLGFDRVDEAPGPVIVRLPLNPP